VENLLRESEGKLKDLMQNIQVGVLLQGSQAEILMSNQKALEYLGISEDQLLGKTSFDKDWNVIHEDGSPFPGHTHPVPQAIETRSSVQNVIMGVYRPLIRDRVWLLVGAEPMLNSDGTVRYVVCSFVNITKRKLAEEALQTLNVTLEERVAERTHQLETTNKELSFHLNEIEQFTYIATHDLQEPLNTLTNFTSLIQEEYAGKLGADGNKYIEFIYNSAARMSNLVRGLLEYSLLGKESETSIVDCNKIISEVLADMTNSIQNCQAMITVEEMPSLKGYSTELRLLFQNLIDNALKFRKKEIAPEIIISSENLQTEWLFRIEDNGIGLDEKDREKIFVIFKRMQNRKDYEGTGIGLAHCKKIVELHGGKIWVESTKDVGSTFKFTIPIERII